MEEEAATTRPCGERIQPFQQYPITHTYGNNQCTVQPFIVKDLKDVSLKSLLQKASLLLQGLARLDSTMQALP